MDSNLMELQKLLLDLLGDRRKPDVERIALLQPQVWDNPSHGANTSPRPYAALAFETNGASTESPGGD